MCYATGAFGENVSDFPNMCGADGYTHMYAVPRSFTCASGYFLPANATQCYECPSGYTCNGGTFTFNAKMAQGISTSFVPTNAPKACAANTVYTHMYAVPRSFTCASGYFLPANSTTCAVCPTGYTCSGGTYSVNKANAQGIVRNSEYISPNENNTCASNLMARPMNAVFTLKTYQCGAGYYLPANTDGCTICSAGNFCVGGNYTFNDTNDQGIVSATCDNGYNAPAGSATVSDCVPNIIQINWQGAELADVLANHAETCTYGGDVRTPVKAIHIPGMTFVGWVVAPQE